MAPTCKGKLNAGIGSVQGDLTRQPLGLRATRQPLRGIKLPPFTFAKISSQREEIEKQNCAHIFRPNLVSIPFEMTSQ